MATSTRQRFGDREVLVRTGSLIGVCTGALTATFVGVVSLATGNSAGVVDRLPVYVLAGAVAFVAALLVVDHARHHGATVLGRAAATGVAGFVLLGLGSEGVIYAVTAPESVVASHLFVYLVAAAIIATGLGYWSVRNWRDATELVARQGL